MIDLLLPVELVKLDAVEVAGVAEMGGQEDGEGNAKFVVEMSEMARTG